jgi:hypothetical protein
VREALKDFQTHRPSRDEGPGRASIKCTNSSDHLAYLSETIAKAICLRLGVPFIRASPSLRDCSTVAFGGNGGPFRSTCTSTITGPSVWSA